MKDSLKDLNLIPVDAELDQEQVKSIEEAHGCAVSSDFSFSVGSRRDERFLAFYLLYAVDRSDYVMTLDEAIDAFESGFETKVPQDSFAIALAHRALCERFELDAYLVPFLKRWPLERLGCCTRLILRLAVSELRQKNAVGSIVINEAIELAKTFAEKDAYRFINGILDEVAKSLQDAKVQGKEKV